MNNFIFKSFFYDKPSSTAHFNYSFEDGQAFEEVVQFNESSDYDETILNRAMFLAFVLIGTSYYKTFPSRDVVLGFPIDDWQANFFNSVYQDGLSQFAYENNLKRINLANFHKTTDKNLEPINFTKTGILALQSGGKDSLLSAKLLKLNNKEFTSFYVSSGDNYPLVLDKIGSNLVVCKRLIDHANLKKAKKLGAMNGHVPVTYIVQSLALIQAILLGKNVILSSIAHEGEESHAKIGDLEVRHQWSKIFDSEMQFSEYVKRYISPDIKIGSPLRGFSELKVSKLFIDCNWKDYKNDFSSCNIANYRQGADNRELKWCGNCPKCANSYLLFAPFLEKAELMSIFNDEDLFEKDSLIDEFKGLLGIDNVIKPFECIGEIEELRRAYYMAHQDGAYAELPFDVPESNYDYLKKYDFQEWTQEIVGGY